ncbi:MAG: serine/threonine protein kinase [Chthoniobacterales bacterium]|nr:serine/threonine protein kinase [Chthoniobacterales bacterium]
MANESSSTPESTETLDNALPVESGTENVFEACPSCQTLMDMSDVMPFTEVTCPGCQHKMRARQHFNHFTLIEQIGEGGMGAVYKALDNNLNRYVALKILKKEISANAEEQEKLAKEARLTAAINHPHVVKVYHFGRDHGQFYLAMELVEKGSLDQLMSIQKRIGEAQVLQVGTQIAMGLGAALELDLIHRDIKPGNILFADAHTAKLVDFGLAIVMDEEASVRGEIWGTPYYIAPEKLDNQPEDFRSDIYSLGGTLFHALAGRPPYEAESASMVALKQLKSQQVSLQAFAPDISSETAYVINRMMAKNPEERYQSYEDLVGHLTYAREKLLEKSRKPIQPKQRALLETEETRKFSAILSLILIGVVLLGGLGLYVLRDKIFPPTIGSGVGKGPSLMSQEAAQEQFLSGVTTLAGGDFEGAKTEFQRLAAQADFPQPQKNWTVLNGALASLLLGDTSPALSRLKKLSETELYSTKPEDQQLANFFVEVSRVVSQNQPISSTIRSLYAAKKEAFALLIFAVWDWEAKGDFANAGALFQTFMRQAMPEDWVSQYKPLAEKYLADWKLLEPIEKAFAKLDSPAAASALEAQIAEARSNIQTGSKISDRLDALEQKAKARGATP